jgi:hypothetical protein
MARPKRPKGDEERLTVSVPKTLKLRFAIEAKLRGKEQRELLIEILEAYFAQVAVQQPIESTRRI